MGYEYDDDDDKYVSTADVSVDVTQVCAADMNVMI